ncbi:GNAT family acetyltransferase [Gynuella sp.]|uniref:GNAT family acetyltransferase n=1 Tax=Gynuella sp. TaxID=2969146 RepID=UPI003D13CBB0
MSNWQIRPFLPEDTDQVIQLWKRCGLLVSWNNPWTDIERKINHSPELFLVATNEQQQVLASIMIGYDGHRASINYLAVSPELQGQGLGMKLMSIAEQKLIALGCPKINLFVRASNTKVLDFYDHQDFHRETSVAFGKRLIEDDPYTV